MKALWLAVLLLFGCLASPAYADVKPGSLSLGVEVGSLTGVDAKFWLNRVHAIDVELGSMAGSALALQATYLWHRYHVFHSDRDDLENNLPLYFGVGGLFAGSGDSPYGHVESLAAVRGVMGIDYIFAQEPFDVFLELAPTMTVDPSAAFFFQAGLGGRYRF